MPRFRRRETRGDAGLGGSPLRRFGLLLVCAKASLVPLFFDPSGTVAFALPKAQLSHVLSFALGAALVAIAVRYRGAALPRFSLLLAGVGMLVLSYTLATLLALDQFVALFGSADRLLGLVTMLDFVVLYLGFVVIVRSQGDLMAIGAAAYGAAVIVVAYAVIQRFGLDPLPWAFGSAERPFSTLGNSTVLSQYLAVLLMMAIALVLTTRPRGRGLAVITWIGVVLGMGLILSGGRSGIAAVAAGGAILMLLMATSTNSPDRTRVVAIGLAATVAIAAAIAVGPAGARIQVLVSGLSQPANDSADARALPARLLLYEVALQEWTRRPVLGVGPDNFSVAYPELRPERSFSLLRTDAPETSPHNFLLRLLTDAGVAGLAGFLMILAGIWMELRRKGRTPAMVVGVVGVAAFLGGGVLTVNDVGTEWLLWASLGLISTTVGMDHPNERLPRRHATSRSHEPVMIGGIVLLTLAVAFLEMRPVQASAAALASRSARAAGAEDRAVRNAQTATELDPGRAGLWHELGLSHAAAQQYDEAVEAFQAAVARAPYHGVYRVNLARAYAALASGGNDAARALATREADLAVRLDRNNPTIHRARAEILLAIGRAPDAVSDIEEVRRLDPVIADIRFFELAGRIYLSAGVPAKAVEVLETSVVRLGPEAPEPRVRLLLAEALIGAGRRADAVTVIERVLAREPNNERARALLREATRN